MYYKIVYTNNISGGDAEEVKCWIIKIRPDEQHDKSLLAHAMTHVEQFWRTWGLHVFLRFYLPYKLKCEVEAYKNQLKVAPGHEKHFAKRLANNYGFNITEEEALKLLME